MYILVHHRLGDESGAALMRAEKQRANGCVLRQALSHGHSCMLYAVIAQENHPTTHIPLPFASPFRCDCGG